MSLFRLRLYGRNQRISGIFQGARQQHGLIAVDIEKCFNCNYCSKDISECKNSQIIEDKEFQETLDNELLEKISFYRHSSTNNIINYILAGRYYSSINDNLNSALCYLQASDLIYGELIYFEDTLSI